MLYIKYILKSLSTKRVVFFLIKQFCQTQNSRLAEIEDAREDNFIRQHLLDYGKQGMKVKLGVYGL